MKRKGNIIVGAIIIIVLVSLIIPGSSKAQHTGTNRTELQRNNLSSSGREVIQVRVDIDAGVVYPKHSHPGEEIVYVLEGILEYQLEGKQPVILKAGEVLFIPYGTPHSVKNIGSGKASEIATYIVEKGKPLLQLTTDKRMRNEVIFTRQRWNIGSNLLCHTQKLESCQY